MFDKLISKIFETSKEIDKKDCNQKLMKLVEEVGELSQAMLIQQSASGTKYRDKEDYSVQEEIADVFLCIVSLCSVMDIDKRDLFDSINDKLRKWESKVKSEKKDSDEHICS